MNTNLNAGQMISTNSNAGQIPSLPGQTRSPCFGASFIIMIAVFASEVVRAYEHPAPAVLCDDGPPRDNRPSPVQMSSPIGPNII